MHEIILLSVPGIDGTGVGSGSRRTGKESLFIGWICITNFVAIFVTIEIRRTNSGGSALESMIKIEGMSHFMRKGRIVLPLPLKPA